MDGLLIDSERVYTETTLLLLQNHDKPASFPMSIKSRMMGRPGPQAAEIFLAWSGIPISVETYQAEQRALQLSRFPHVKTMPGAAALLKSLDRERVPIALATSSTTSNFALKSSNLKDFFSVFGNAVICGDDPRIVGRGKPMPDIFLHSLAHINQMEREAGREEIKPEECLVLEDGVPGVQAGLSAGMQVLWVPDQEILALHEGQIEDVLGERGTMVKSLEEFPWEIYGLKQ